MIDMPRFRSNAGTIVDGSSANRRVVIANTSYRLSSSKCLSSPTHRNEWIQEAQLILLHERWQYSWVAIATDRLSPYHRIHRRPVSLLSSPPVVSLSTVSQTATYCCELWQYRRDSVAYLLHKINITNNISPTPSLTDRFRRIGARCTWWHHPIVVLQCVHHL